MLSCFHRSGAGEAPQPRTLGCLGLLQNPPSQKPKSTRLGHTKEHAQEHTFEPTKEHSYEHATQHFCHLTSATPNTKLPPAMPYKRKRSSAEIEALADQIRDLWQPAEAVRPWLRQHAVMFRTMVHSGWTWQGLADALKCAGITYQTGNALRGVILKNEVARACKALKSAAPLPAPDKVTRPVSVPHLAPHRQNETLPHDASADRASDTMSQPPTVPRFKRFSLKPQEPPRPLTPTEIEEREANRIRMFGQ